MYRSSKLTFALLAAAIVMGCAGPAAAQLLTRSAYSTFKVPGSVVTADFNQDGIMDLAVGSFEGSSGVQVFLGKGDGTFQPPVAYDPGTGANALATADLNHDGIPDLVVANDVGESVTVLLGKGDGTFQAPLTYAIPSVAAAVVLGDFNGDGNLDIATTDQSDLNTSCACVSVLLGNGDGTFREPAVITYPPYSLPQGLAAGYFNGDKNLDLAVTLGFINFDTVQILLGNGDGTFTLGASYTIGPLSQSIVAADLRRNVKTDLAVAEFEGVGVAVLLGNGDGTFEQPVEYHAQFPEAVAVGDMTGDGIPDLVAAGSSSKGLVYIFPGRGDGTFGNPGIVRVGDSLRGLAVADFNGDHQLDVTVADQTGDVEYTLLNTGKLWISPTSPVAFPVQLVNTTSTPKTVVLSNVGVVPIFISSLTWTGNFQVSNGCGSSVGAGQSCNINVIFAPKDGGYLQGTITLFDSASSKPQVIVLEGPSTPLALSPAQLNFGSQKVGTTSPPQQVTVTNLGSAAVTFNFIYIGGKESADFSIDSETCSVQLAAGASCTVTITFAPTKIGSRKAFNYVTLVGTPSPTPVTLVGTGT